MSRVGLRRISFTVPHAGARAHALSVAGTNGRAIPHAVFVLESTLQQVGDDLHVAVRMHGETVAPLHPVFVNHAQGTESHEARVVVLIKGKSKVRVEPAEIASAPLIATPDRDHSGILVITTIWMQSRGKRFFT